MHPTANSDATFTCPAEIKDLRVLLVDDEPDIRGILMYIFETCKAIHVGAASVPEALEILKTDKSDILISDIGMPERDGYALIRNIRQIPAKEGGNIPAVALTTYARVEDRLRVLSAGFQMHVPKPVDPVELLAVAASLIKRTENR